MSKTELLKLFKDRGIITLNNKLKSMYNYLLNKLENSDLRQLADALISEYASEKEAWFCLIHDVDPPSCPLCGCACKFNGDKSNGGYKTTCSNCSANSVPSKIDKFKISVRERTPELIQESTRKRNSTLEQRYGDPNYGKFGSESFLLKMENKYGDPHYSNHEQAKQTCLERYGVESNFLIEGFQERSQQTKRERYGNTSNYEKTKVTNMQVYGVPHISLLPAAQKKMLKKKQASIVRFEKENNCVHRAKLTLKYGTGWLTALKDITVIMDQSGRHYYSALDVAKIASYYNSGHCHTNSYTSKGEKELVEFIQSIYNGTIIENDTTAVPNSRNRYFELDIYLPELKIAIDYNGDYYHSTVFKDKYYHQRKSVCAYAAGIRLAHVFEYQWKHETERIKQKLIELITTDKSFDDGLFPYLDINVKLGEPQLCHTSEKDYFEYYDCGKEIK